MIVWPVPHCLWGLSTALRAQQSVPPQEILGAWGAFLFGLVHCQLSACAAVPNGQNKIDFAQGPIGNSVCR